MEKQSKKKITWTIKNFSLECGDRIYSDQFLVGGCKWRLCAYRDRIFDKDLMYYYLEVADYRSLPSGWRRHARYLLYLVNRNEEQKWFDESCPDGYNLLSYSRSNYQLAGELKVVAELEVLEVIGKLDVSNITSTITEDVNGFELVSSQSQVELVTHVFERHPDIASEFRPKNPNLRRGYMSLLLSLIETLCQPPHVLHKADLSEAYAALESMTAVGFKLDWLEKKLDEMSGKKKKEEDCEKRMHIIENELKDLKQKCLDLETELEKERVEFSAAKAPISFDEVI